MTISGLFPSDPQNNTALFQGVALLDTVEINVHLGAFEGQGSIGITWIYSEYPSGHLEGVDVANQGLFSARSPHSYYRIVCKLSARCGAKC